MFIVFSFIYVLCLGCVSERRLLVVMSSLTVQQERKNVMHTPRLKVWKKMREPNLRHEFAVVISESKNEVFETDNVESKWNAMKEA